MKKRFTASIIILSGAMLLAAAEHGEAAGRWNFDSPQTLYRSNGLTLHGKASPAKGIVGGGMHFDGKDQYLSLNLSGNAQPGEEMTAAFWFKAEPGSACFPAVRHSNSYFVASGGPGFSWYEITGVNGRVYDGYAHPRLLNYNEWYHFALVYESAGTGGLSGRQENPFGQSRQARCGETWRQHDDRRTSGTVQQPVAHLQRNHGRS